LHAGTQVAGWTARDIHTAVLTISRPMPTASTNCATICASSKDTHWSSATARVMPTA
jgi:hypothetical protein